MYVCVYYKSAYTTVLQLTHRLDVRIISSVH